ncbi:MAG: helix-turn-helix domain-containing protein [Planctomycetota bacterium]
MNRTSGPQSRRVLVWIDTRVPSARGMLEGVRSFCETVPTWHVAIPDQRDDPIDDYLERWQPDGLIGLPDKRTIKRFESEGLPVVVTSSRGAVHESRKVYSDPKAAAESVRSHFEDVGCVSCAVLTDSREPSPAVRRRVAAFTRDSDQRSTNSAKSVPVLDLAQAVPNHGLAARIDAVGAWLDHLDKPAGVWTTSDQLGWLAIESAVDRRWKVPDDIAVVGSNDDDIVCNFVRPTLSSLATDQVAIGYRSAELLEMLFQGRRPPRRPIRFTAKGVTVRDSSKRSKQDDLVDAALRHIERHLAGPLAVDDLLDVLPASRRTLERRFRQTLGKSPHAQIRGMRIARAQQLLLTTQLRVSEVAASCGYEHVSQLSRDIRQATGQTPSGFRIAMLSGQSTR